MFGLQLSYLHPLYCLYTCECFTLLIAPIAKLLSATVTIRGQHTCENCELEPLVSIVERIKQDNVEVVWMEGGYTKAWRVAKQLDPKNHRKKFDWKDIVPKSSIIMFDFKLTSNNHLRKLTVDHLKKSYLELKQSN